MPSKNYPPASPYANLTDYFRELIQNKTLTRFIVKALLYPEFLRDIDTTEVHLRRRHKTVVRMYHQGSTSSETASDNSSSERLRRQNTLENYRTSEDESKIYSGLNYKTGKHDSWDRTIYESFIDYGEGAGEIRYQKLHDSSFCFVTECDSPEARESFMIGSKPIRYTPLSDARKNSSDNITHLSTARMNLLSIKQRSEQSQNSSFENDHKLSGEKWKNMGYEDLLNIDEMPRNSSRIPMQERHHSMPIQFVGNRFNASSITEIFIPSCKDYTEKNILATPCNSFEIQEEHEEKSIYSNSSQRDEVDFSNNVFGCDKIQIDEILSKSVLSKENEDVFHPKRCDSHFLPPATIYSSDSDSGMAGSYTLSPSDQPFGFSRSFISHVSHPSNLISTSSRSYNAKNSIYNERAKEKDDSTEAENRTKLVVNIESGNKRQSNESNNLYYSAMYVHWWRKESLPEEMIEAIVTSPNHNEASIVGKGIEKGSGKKKLLKTSLTMLHSSVFNHMQKFCFIAFTSIFFHQMYD
jgi:hypothetical protein